MATISNEACLNRLRIIYRDAFKIPLHSITNEQVIDWATAPELWAEHQIRYRGWTYHATEATIRQCRILRKRASLAAQQQAAEALAGHDPFDPLLPCVDGSCSLTQDATN